MTRRKTIEPPFPTMEQLEKARTLFEAYEPWDLFYRAATELVSLALEGKTTLSVAESLAVLLQTWNAMYYRFHPFNTEHFQAFESVVSSQSSAVAVYRSRSIMDFATDEFQAISDVFTAFEMVLGPVGAAKALHLLAPQFFPLWDREIVKSYGISLGASGQNSVEYLRFMMIVVSQVEHLNCHDNREGLLKRIDEFNYCRFTKVWQ
jgi:hypothetical protein